jgi:hypothetical protein
MDLDRVGITDVMKRRCFNQRRLQFDHDKSPTSGYCLVIQMGDNYIPV